jgi:hypothetical protein
MSRAHTIAMTLLVLLAGSTPARSAGDLFPQPFVVEHHMVQHDPDGSTFVGEPVVDHYTGSQIISVRPDGSRIVIDLARRELTEVDASRGVYSVIGFDRLAELQRRLAKAERMQVGIVDQAASATGTEGSEAGTDEGDTEPDFVIETVPAGATSPVLGDIDLRKDLSEKAERLLDRKGVERVVVRLKAGDGAGSATAAKAAAEDDSLAVEVWLDPRVRLTAAARQALGSFERDVLASAAAPDRVPFSRYIAAAREQASGALPIRIVRPATSDPAKASRSGVVEDIATRLEPEAAISDELRTIPDGCRRQPHVLEGVVAFSEEEAERNLRSLRGAR